MNSRTYITDALHRLPPLDQLEDYLDKELDTFIGCVFPAKYIASCDDEGLESLSPLPPIASTTRLTIPFSFFKPKSPLISISA